MLSSVEVLGSGAALAGCAGWWRVRQRRFTDRQLRTALWDPDRAARLAGVEVVGNQSLRANGPLLAEWVLAEHDPAVLAAMAGVIERNRWEPATDPLVIQLRLWARRFLADAGGAPSEREVGVPPAEREVGVARSASAPDRPSSAPDRCAGDATGVPAAGEVAGPGKSWSPPGLAPQVVLVTGVGGPAGVAVVRELRAGGHQVVGADADPHAVGHHLCERSAVIPRADDPVFATAVAALAAETGARVLLSTVAEEFEAIWESADVLGEVGLAYWLPPPEAVARCLDKWAFAQLLGEAGLPGPATALGETADVPGPWIVKPRFGRGSRDVMAVDSPDELDWALKRVPDPLVQHRLEGSEFTVDVLVGREGGLLGAVPRWREETRGGISTRGSTFHDAELVRQIGFLVRALGLEGPANVQGFMDSDGLSGFTEVNPRFSGGLPLSIAAGCDLVEEYLRGILGDAPRADRLSHRSGVRMKRHFVEVFEE